MVWSSRLWSGSGLGVTKKKLWEIRKMWGWIRGGVTLSLTEKKKKEKMKNERNNVEGWANQQRNLNEGNNSNKMQNSAGKLKEVTASHSLHSEDSVEKLPPKRRIPC